MPEDVTPPAFAPIKGRPINAQGPSWSTAYAANTLARIRRADSVETATAQAVTEVAILLHSIRRVLIWPAVIIPASSPGSGSC